MIGQIYIPDLRVAAANRPIGYVEDVLSAGRIENDVLNIESEVYLSLKQKYMEPLIQSLTQNLKPCAGCGKDLSDPVYDSFWKPKENTDGMDSSQTDSSRSGDARGSGDENQ